MIKREEIADSSSCLNKARDDEPIFVLLARDAAAIHAVMCWINARIELGLNIPTDGKLDEAVKWCVEASKWRDDNGRRTWRATANT